MIPSPHNRPGIDSRPTYRQRGVMLPLFVIALVAMLGLVGLAVDGGHGMLNKARLQNIVDAAALSAAKVLDETAFDTALAEAEAIATFQRNAAGPGNAEIAASYSGGDIVLSVQFSNTLHPFVPGTSPGQYVRVRASNFRLPGWFIPVLGFNEKVVGASAVAGPSPTFLHMACNVAPMMVCGDPGGGELYGYELGAAQVLKFSTTGSEVGPGNFQLIRLDGGPGAANVRRALAGSFDTCLRTDEDIETEPGNAVGPVAQGLNTRFGEYLGPMQGMQDQYPPDWNVTEPSPPLTYDADEGTLWNGEPIQPNGSDGELLTYEFYDYAQYMDELPNTADYQGPGVPGRRTMAVPVGDCSTTTNGQGTVPLLGFGCYHLLQKAQQQGNQSHVYGQFVDGCTISGRPGPEPGAGPGPYIIQLYKDEDAEAS